MKSLSVIVIGRNEGERLNRCLESVRTMSYPADLLELIYVDSASTDNSVEIARGRNAQIVPLAVARPTAARARNAGFKSASGEFILFLDGDTILHPGFAIASLPFFDQPSIAVVFGHRREINPDASLFNRVVDLDWISRPGLADFCGGDSLMRRAALEQANGFDETLIAGEEPELCCRLRSLGWQIMHIDHAMTGHDIAMYTWSQYWRRALRTGYAYAQVSKRFASSSLPLWSAEARQNRNRALVLVCGAFATVAATLIPNPSPAHAIAAIGLFAALVFRTAIKNRWKQASLFTRILYGIHSHLQQIPIYAGQLQHAIDTRRGRSRALIEYKAAQ